MTFVETKLFTELVLDYLSDDEYAAMQEAGMTSPASGFTTKDHSEATSFAATSDAPPKFPDAAGATTKSGC